MKTEWWLEIHSGAGLELFWRFTKGGPMIFKNDLDAKDCAARFLDRPLIWRKEKRRFRLLRWVAYDDPEDTRDSIFAVATITRVNQ